MGVPTYFTSASYPWIYHTDLINFFHKFNIQLQKLFCPGIQGIGYNFLEQHKCPPVGSKSTGSIEILFFYRLSKIKILLFLHNRYKTQLQSKVGTVEINVLEFTGQCCLGNIISYYLFVHHSNKVMSILFPL